MYNRKMEGGKGFVFQSRFKSTLIEKAFFLACPLFCLPCQGVEKRVLDSQKLLLSRFAKIY